MGNFNCAKLIPYQLTNEREGDGMERREGEGKKRREEVTDAVV